VATSLLDRIADGRTDLVFDHVGGGHPATTLVNDASLINWCAYYGDVSGIRFLLASGESLESLSEDGNLGLGTACFHGHWQLCEFLIEHGADVNFVPSDTGETALHNALVKPASPHFDLVVRVLLGKGANPNVATKPNVETGAFMRDCRTKGETPLHRAAAFGTEDAIQMLLDAGAVIDARDMNGETPLSWGSWYARPDTVLRKLCYGRHHIRAGRKSMEAYLRGTPHV
jgi:ankyrin repeat protein